MVLEYKDSCNLTFHVWVKELRKKEGRKIGSILGTGLLLEALRAEKRQ
jgi:hypothetical protein